MEGGSEGGGGLDEPQPSSPLAREGPKVGRDAVARGAQGRGCALSRGGEGARGPYRAEAVGRRAASTPAWPPERAVPKPPAQAAMRLQRRAGGCRWLAEGCASPTADSLGLVQSRGGGTSPQRPGQRASPWAARRAELAQHCAEPTCLPWSAACAPGARGNPTAAGETGCGPAGEVARTGWLGPYCGSRESPDLCFRFQSVRRAVTHRPPSLRGHL